MPAKPIPAGYHSLTPYLAVRDASAAIAFYAKAFGATEVLRMAMPDGSVAHAEVQVGDSRFMLSDENPAWGNLSPQSVGGCTGGLMLYVEDADAVYAQALAAGATAVRPVADQFYGDRSGTVLDPFGHKWTVGTHVEDVPHAELQARMDAMMAGAPA